MSINLEVQAGSYVPISEATARKIIERLMSLCEDMNVMADDEVIHDLKGIQTFLSEAGLQK